MLVSAARSLAEKHLASPMPVRWQHVLGVVDRAEWVSCLLGLDPAVLEAASWLHDIGYSDELVETGLHSLDGARYLSRKGFPLPVVQLVAHHSGASIEAEERGLREELLSEFPFEPSLMLDALWFCDLTTGPDGQGVSVEERLAEIRARYGPSDVVTRFVDRAEPELIAAVRRVELELAAVQSR